MFDKRITRILDSVFLDIDEYNPEELYDPNDRFNIDENELKARLIDKLATLNQLIEVD